MAPAENGANKTKEDISSAQQGVSESSSNYYGKNGYGPNGQAVYAPVATPKVGQKDQQGNGHLHRDDYRGLGGKSTNEYKSSPRNGNNHLSQNFPAMNMNSQFAQQGMTQMPQQNFPMQNGYGMPYGQPMPQQGYAPYGYPMMPAFGFGFPMQNGYGMPYGQPMPQMPMQNGYGTPYGQPMPQQMSQPFNPYMPQYAPYNGNGNPQPQQCLNDGSQNGAQEKQNEEKKNGNGNGVNGNTSSMNTGFQGANLPR
jgi:hypothetical protein